MFVFNLGFDVIRSLSDTVPPKKWKNMFSIVESQGSRAICQSPPQSSGGQESGSPWLTSRLHIRLYKSGLAFLLTWPRISLLRVCYRLLFSNLPILQLMSDIASEFLAFLLARPAPNSPRSDSKVEIFFDSDYQRNTIGLQQF